MRILSAALCSLAAACGGGSNPHPAPLVFTSVPVTMAFQGQPYSYQLQVTAASGATVSFALTAAPDGAVLNGNTILWTPTASQSRVPDNFVVTASIAGGGASTQSWSVIPSGTVTLTFIDTFWTGNGPVTVPAVFPGTIPFPAALVPQSDGSLTALHGTSASPGVFTIPNVPGGHYWLEVGPAAIFWTSASTFDFGADLIGTPLSATTPNTTVIGANFSNLDPIQKPDWLGFVMDVQSFNLDEPMAGAAGSTTFAFGSSIGSNIDFSKVTNIFVAQYEPAAPAALQALVMGPALTLTNPGITNGGVNNISGALIASPESSLNISVRGSAWANAVMNIAPVNVVPLGSSLFLSAQPFLTDRNAIAMSSFLGPNLPLIAPAPPVNGTIGLISCDQRSSGASPQPLPSNQPPPFNQPPILSDEDFGAVQYGDPFPLSWPRVFSFCQGFDAKIPAGNSGSTQSFLLQNGQASSIPAAPVVPLLTAVQNPQINGAGLFTPVTLNSGTITLTWDPPALGHPFGYYIQEFVLVTVNGVSSYVPASRFGVAVNSITMPPLPPGTNVVFMISAVADANAVMETSPRRSALPTAYADVLSAPITISSSASSTETHDEKSSEVQQLLYGKSPASSMLCPLQEGSPECSTIWFTRH